MVLLILPLIYLGLVIWLHASLMAGRSPPQATLMMRSIRHFEQWMMGDVFLIGVLVSLVKILSLASVGFGVSFWAFCFYVVLILLLTRSIDRDWLWERIAPEPAPPVHLRPGAGGMAQQVAGCTACGCPNHYDPRHANHCHRCGEKLYLRRRHSLQKTLALLLVSVILYIPAMTLPIMTVSSLSDTTTQTIMAGVLLLLDYGDYPIAAIIFIASVVVPVAKLLALAWLCYKVKRPGPFRPEVRIRLYRITEFIGRWSMIDVFVVALLAALVRLGSLMSVAAEPGIIAFGAVVVLTMIAAMSFDPRLIWDGADSDDADALPNTHLSPNTHRAPGAPDEPEGAGP